MQIKEGTWWEEGGVRRTVSQRHEVIGFFGGKWLQIITQFLVGLSLLGTCIAQVVASSGNLYSIDNSHSKRSAAASCDVFCCLDLVPCHVISACLPCCGRACVSSGSTRMSTGKLRLRLNSAVRLQRRLFCCQTADPMSMNALIVHNHSVVHRAFVILSIT